MEEKLLEKVIINPQEFSVQQMACEIDTQFPAHFEVQLLENLYFDIQKSYQGRCS